MGVAAAIASAAVWALAAAMMASQTSRVDALSISAIRACWAAIFFVILLFASGESGEIGGMSTWVMAQLMLSAVIGLSIGDTLYVTEAPFTQWDKTISALTGSLSAVGTVATASTALEGI